MSASSTQTNDLSPQHPIQVVARRTGLSAEVIRAWERRYSAIKPIRTANSRRLYSDADVTKLVLLHRATTIGRRIGDIAHLSIQDLAELVANDEQAVSKLNRESSERPTTGSIMEHFDECLDAISKLDAFALNAALTRAAQTVGIPFLLEDLLRPLITHAREECRRGSLQQAHESLTIHVIRAYLYNSILSTPLQENRPLLIIATPLGQHYDITALRTTVAAIYCEWNAIYIGTNLPADEIEFAVHHTQSVALALSIAQPTNDPHLPNELRRLRKILPTEIPVLCGGSAISMYADVMKEIDAKIYQTIGELRISLDRIAQQKNS